MRASDAGLSTTTTSSGLLEDARMRPHVPSATVTLTPFTVTRSRIGSPANFSPPLRARSDLIAPPLHIGVACLPVFRSGSVFSQHRIGHEQAGRLHIGDEGGLAVLRGEIAREHDADFIGKDLLPFIIDDTAAIAVAI